MTLLKTDHPTKGLWLWVMVMCLLAPGLRAENEAPQVRIEARVLEWQRSGSLDVDFAVAYQRNSGNNSNVESADLTLFSNPALGSAARLFFDDIETDAGSFDAVIQTLETAGTVRILSRPYNVVTSSEVPLDQINDFKLNGKNEGGHTQNVAILSNATEVPYETAKAVGRDLVSVTAYQDAGVSMVVSVQKVIDESLVVMTMETTVSDVTGFINVGLNRQDEPMRVPTLDTRKIKSRLIVRDGKVFIAGLMKTTEQVEQHRGIPWLSELPILKYFLSSTRTVNQDRELVFLVKAEILTPYKSFFPIEVEPAE